MLMGFIVGILSHELLKYNYGLSYFEATNIVQTVLKTHEGEPDTGTLWLMMIQETEDAAREYLANKVLENGRENEGSTQSGT
jgi:hypothetical protein